MIPCFALRSKATHINKNIKIEAKIAKEEKIPCFVASLLSSGLGGNPPPAQLRLAKQNFWLGWEPTPSAATPELLATPSLLRKDTKDASPGEAF